MMYNSPSFGFCTTLANQTWKPHALCQPFSEDNKLLFKNSHTLLTEKRKSGNKTFSSGKSGNLKLYKCSLRKKLKKIKMSFYKRQT